VHHVTQRGNARQYLLATDSERMVYLDLLRQAVHVEGLSVMAYCLMSNHVHLVVIPRRAEALAVALKQAHGRYAAYWNAAHTVSGHAWQALCYTELNPVRDGMSPEAAAWPWSSVAAHCGTGNPDACLDLERWGRLWTAASWRKYLDEGETESELDSLRQYTRTGRPLGSAEFVDGLEQNTQRRLAPQKGGRPRKTVANDRQEAFAFPKVTRQSARARPTKGKN
jgi:putative transposase